MLQSTTFTTSEEGPALLGETILWVLDLRLTHVVAEQDSTDPHQAQLAWADLLPRQGQTLHEFRERFGWQEWEIIEIRKLLLKLHVELYKQSEADGILDGTAATLQRDGDKVAALVERWGTLLSEDAA